MRRERLKGFDGFVSKELEEPCGDPERRDFSDFDFLGDDFQARHLGMEEDEASTIEERGPNFEGGSVEARGRRL